MKIIARQARGTQTQKERKAWCAEITGADEKFGLERNFLSLASREAVYAYSGDYMAHTFEVEEGKIYEMNTVLKIGYNGERQFFTIRNGEQIFLTAEQVTELLTVRAEAESIITDAAELEATPVAEVALTYDRAKAHYDYVQAELAWSPEAD